MGKIKVNFVHPLGFDNDSVSKFKTDARIQYLQVKYWIKKIEEIEYSGENFPFTFEINPQTDSLNWDSLTYPDEDVKGKVFELIYYNNIKRELENIIGKIDRCRFDEIMNIYSEWIFSDDRFELIKFGEESVEIIRNIKEPRFFSNLNLNKTKTIEDINHTIEKEGKLLLKLKKSDSKRAKNNIMGEVKSYFCMFIKNVIFSIEHFDVNKS